MRDIGFDIAKNPKYDGHQRGLAAMVINFFLKYLLHSQINLLPVMVLKNENMSEQPLAEELYKTITKKFKNRNVQSPFVDNIQAADLADMQLINTFNNGVCFLLCVVDIFSK